MILVDGANLEETILALSKEKYLALDCESTGLRPHHGDRLFCLVIATAQEEYYFNFHPEHPNYLDETAKPKLASLFNTPFIGFIAHNAKFDLAMLEASGINLGYLTYHGDIHDTMTRARLLDNTRASLSLASCAEDLGEKKDTSVEEYIKEHELFTKVEICGRDQALKNLHYDRVPFDLISKYAAKDVRITYDLFFHQQKRFDRLIASEPKNMPSISKVLAVDKELLSTVYLMEKKGILIDREYCENALLELYDRTVQVESDFFALTNLEFKNSSLLFTELFKDEKILYGEATETGKVNPRFDSEALKTYKHPAVELILKWRDLKKTSEYFHAFLYQADSNNRLHPSLNQAGTVTGRFASFSPNLQNLTKDESSEADSILVRRAFIPYPDYLFVMLDYDQMEYKLMLDYAEALSLIEKVKSGLDVHSATAEVAKITRSEAKTTNFSILYGAGLKLLASRLKVEVKQAKEIRDTIFSSAPEVEAFIKMVMGRALKNKFIFNWQGRRYLFPDSRYVYRAPNYLIQGGCADIVKTAMIRIEQRLRRFKSRMVLCIHDEIVLCVHKDELFLIPEIKKIMESVYVPFSGLGMSCGVEFSYKNLADKTEGFPGGTYL